ncbi:MAG: phosphoheptose isomerase, partial [Ignavibacteriales bacterium]|nr:phosphoheptose isomerase [Ignavibacteriales bacterium]
MHTITYLLSEHLNTNLENKITGWSNSGIIKRIWDKDPFVWKSNPQEHKELADRLGWLQLPETMLDEIAPLISIANEVKEKFNKVILLGMGGSSLAPEVFSRVFGSAPGYPALSIIDSTHPAVIEGFLETLDLEKTIFVMASKSGGTSETNSFFYTFYEALQKKGLHAGGHFIALTDPGTKLEKLAKEKEFAYIVSTPPEVGGRYSVLTPFGILPAALIGIDIKQFLTAALTMQKSCGPDVQDKANPGLYLGLLLGELAMQNVNKITFITGKEVALFPQWVEQLVAESTGKEGKGILPVVDEPIADISHYGTDRAFVFLQMKEHVSEELEAFKQLLLANKFPVISIELENVYDLAGEFYRWEMA